MNNTYTLLLLTLNEIDGIEAIYHKINKNLFSKIVILDGGSTDGTIEWAKKNNVEIYIQKKKGFRHAYFEYFDQITTSHVITFSPDGNSIPELLENLIKELDKKFEMVIVSRYKANAKSFDDDLITSFGNWLFRFLINLLYSSNITDPMVIYRGFKKSLINDLNLLDEKSYSLPEKIFNTQISWEPLMSIRAMKRKINFSEIPGDEPERIGGERKLQILKWGSAYMFQVFYERFTK
jgi:glycosyltransferase involved in cell wall biosynthesis